MSKFTFNADGSLVSTDRSPASDDGRRAVSTVVAGVTIRAVTDREIERTGAAPVIVLEQNGVQEFVTGSNDSNGISRAALRLQSRAPAVNVDAIIRWAQGGGGDQLLKQLTTGVSTPVLPPAPGQTQTAQTFDVVGPPGATVEQAREVFNQQRATGSLVGLKPGDVLDANVQFESGLAAAASQLGGLRPPTTGFDLSNVPVSQALTAANFAQQRVPSFSLGPLTSSDLQGLKAQAAAQSGQAVDQISADQGVGKYGLDVSKLESAGVVKPGTASSLSKAPPPSVTQADIDEAERINSEGGDITAEQVARNRQLNSFLTPNAFTGKNGAGRLTDVLDDSNLQDKIQSDVLKQSYQGLVQSGVTEQLRDPKQLAAALQTAAVFDVKTAENFVKGQSVPNISEVKTVAKAAEYAKGFAAKFATLLSKGGPLETGIKRPVGVSNTVNRSTVNASVTGILGNPKIPSPTFIPRASADSAADDVRLTYTGSDPIVWDRVNAARLRDGLPGLDEIGLPRPE